MIGCWGFALIGRCSLLSQFSLSRPDSTLRLGPALVYRLVRQKQPKANLNLLWAMAAALRDMDWRELTNEDKERLLADVREE